MLKKDRGPLVNRAGSQTLMRLPFRSLGISRGHYDECQKRGEMKSILDHWISKKALIN